MDSDQLRLRVRNSEDVLGHPFDRDPPVQEGTHYEVLAYTDWADSFVPTVIQWTHGELDMLTDRTRSLELRDRATAAVQGAG